MEDAHIVDLYWQRDEKAIANSRQKYGAYCGTIARNILASEEDAEECVADTWLRAWNAIPPQRPRRLSVFFGKITRNLALDRYRASHSQKRGGGQVPLCLEELRDCVGDSEPMADRLALKELLDAFLLALPSRSREVFLLRYWYCMPVSEIAARCSLSEGAVKMQLQRTRDKLRDTLQKEGFGV